MLLRLAPRIRSSVAALGLALGLFAGPPTAVAEDSSSKRFETNAQKLHKSGVRCMETLNRPKCAIKKFEALIEEPTNERELVTDGLLRLVKLYASENRDADIKQMLRVFWEAGKKRSRYGHLAYSARFVPADLDIYGGGEVDKVGKAPLTNNLPSELYEYATTCDQDRQAQIKDLWLLRRAQRRAKKDAITVNQAIVKLHAENLQKRKQLEERRKKREAQSSTPKRPTADPVFAEGTCAVAEALGQIEFSSWSRMSFAMNHRNPARSVAFFNIPELDAQLERAVARGDLQPAGDNVWALPTFKHEGKQVLVARLDLNELTLAPADVMKGIVTRSRNRKKSMNRELYNLLGQVPQDSHFFGAATEAAVRDLGFGGMKKSRRTLAEWFLPRPEGFQMAGVIHEYLGLFARMPTSNPVKAEMLVSIARRMIERESTDNDANDEFLRLLDVAQASDKRALLMSYVLSKSQIIEMMER